MAMDARSKAILGQLADDLRYEDFQDANFINANLSLAEFHRCSIRNTDFADADLKSVTRDHSEPVNYNILHTPLKN
jgi:uncharacterized protein YjbI with pentapeptide repeats